MMAGFGQAIPVRLAVIAEDREKALGILKSLEYKEEQRKAMRENAPEDLLYNDIH